MQDWASYSLQDFVLFSPDVYFRLFELHNLALWPAHILIVTLCLFTLLRLLKPSHTRLRQAWALFAILWLGIGIAFFWQRYTTINWASPYFAPLALIEAILLIVAALTVRQAERSSEPQRTHHLPLLIYTAALLAYPLLGIVQGRDWTSMEILGIAPDPTAVATLALAAMSNTPWRWLLMIIPGLWCVISALTLYALGINEFYLAPLAASLVVIAALRSNQA